jgi:hypothetical protein
MEAIRAIRSAHRSVHPGWSDVYYLLAALTSLLLLLGLFWITRRLDGRAL